jgi:hypothetical protein
MDNKKVSEFNLDIKGKGIVPKYISNKMGRPLTYSDDIGMFICFHISLGKTIKSICELYNKLVGYKTLHPVKIYYWLKNDKLSHFRDQYYYAREIQAQGILDEIIEKETDIANLTLESKSGRVILESLRWRAKIQNPDYFNPVQKTKSEVDHTFVITTQVPDPLPLPPKGSITISDSDE